MSAVDETRAAWAELAHRTLPQAAWLALLRAFGGPRDILSATPARLASVISDVDIARLRRAPDDDALARMHAWLADPAHEVVAWDDPDYPQALLELGAAPPVLFFVGRRELLNRQALAIVGSRNATAQGRDNARAFAHALADAGLTIVSGLALGIDAAAHEGALAGAGSTLAVVGTGLDRVYPARHRELAHAIAARGGLLSEFPPGTPPLARNFPRRNRLISGLARGVLVVEAALASGSLITARLAGEQGREVFAIPGSIHSPLARGCHRLIRDGAKLVECAKDILEELGMHAGTATSLSAQLTNPGDSPLLAALAEDPTDVDTLVARTGLATDAVLSQLTELELAGIVAASPGGRWQRRR
ncbi:MAG: DNA-protecting protein DprA [Burkholderiales bacterium]|nr:DNA-protecting protein DprA [Burkholderiales bacterium]